MMGRLIAFEGGEASGKSTQAARLAQRLGAVLTREPGGTPVGEHMRSLLLDPDTGELDDWTEALLMAAARAQHVADVVGPALVQGRHVVTDRFIHSSLAYQGFGRGLNLDQLRHVFDWSTGGRWPDIVVLLDVAAEEGARRLTGRPDRLEGAGWEFHQRVAEGFRTLAAQEADCWLIVDGSGSADEVEAQVAAAVDERLGELAAAD